VAASTPVARVPRSSYRCAFPRWVTRTVILTTSGSAHVPDGRVLALHFDRIDASAVGTCQP
jgi:hypothetical protein